MADNMETYRTLTPYLVVPDADAEMQFLKNAFGATEASCQRNADQTVMHAELNVGNSLVMLGQANGGWKAVSAALYVWVPDVDAAYARALNAGATSQSAPEDKPYGHRNAGVIDRSGITWWIASPVAQPSPNRNPVGRSAAKSFVCASRRTDAPSRQVGIVVGHTAPTNLAWSEQD